MEKPCIRAHLHRKQQHGPSSLPGLAKCSGCPEAGVAFAIDHEQVCTSLQQDLCGCLLVAACCTDQGDVCRPQKPLNPLKPPGFSHTLVWDILGPPACLHAVHLG